MAMLPGSYSANSDKALPLLLEKLNIEGTRLEACRAFGTIARAKAPVAIAPMLPELLPVLQVRRQLIHFAVLLRPVCFAQQHAQCHACSGTWARPTAVLPFGTCILEALLSDPSTLLSVKLTLRSLNMFCTHMSNADSGPTTCGQ